MALRSLLRRIPNPTRFSPSGPRIVPVHGVSPPAASRFMSTESQGGPKPDAKMYLKDKEWNELVKVTRLHLDEYSRSVNNLGKLANVATAMVAAIPVILIWGSNYKA